MSVTAPQTSANLMQSHLQLQRQAATAFSPELLGPAATVAPPTALDAYSLGQYAAHHQAAAAAAYAAAMQQQAAASFARALMHQQASMSSNDLQPGPAAPADQCTASAFRPFQPGPACRTFPSRSVPAASPSFCPSSTSQFQIQLDSAGSGTPTTCHWGHFMSHEPECRPVAEHKGFGMLGFTPSWSAQQPPASGNNMAERSWQEQAQADWIHMSSATPDLSLATACSGHMNRAATFGNGKLHRPVAARPAVQGRPPMFSADAPSQGSGGSDLTHPAKRLQPELQVQPSHT